MDAPTIAVGICSYGNLKGLNDTLLSVSPLVDQVIIVNVPFLGFPVPEADPPLRIYEKSEILQRPNITLYQTSEPMTQIDARNKYLELTNQTTDFLIPMDDDEIIYKLNRDKFYSKLQKIMEQEEPELFELWYINYDGKPFYNHRLLYKPNRFRYVGNHWNLMIDGRFYGQSGRREVDGLTLQHISWQDAGRTREWEKAFERYEILQMHDECQTPTQIIDKYFRGNGRT